MKKYQSSKLEKELELTKKDIEIQKQKIEELTDNWKRALADYQNLTKRYEKEKADFVQFANTNLILKLLSILDHLQKAQEYLKDEGLGLAIKQFREILNEEGLKEVETLGQEFNPQTMEAVEVVNGPDNQVLAVLNNGYWLKDKIIRVAKVKVSKS